jgi:hypothetical protein
MYGISHLLLQAWKAAPAWSRIVAAGVLAHGIVLLTDHVLWDGWWYAADLARADGPAVMSRLFHEVGRPIDMAFYSPMRWLGGNPITWAKWFGVAAWLVAAVCVRDVLCRLVGLPVAVATSVATLVVTLPTFDLLGELALWMNTGCVLLFWLAWLLFSRLQALAGWQAIAVRLAALVMFFVSFDLNSNLVMFYAVAVAIAGLRLPDLQPATLLARLPRVAIRYADFLALPIIFWLWKTWFTPTSGFYATGYNQPSLAPDRLMLGYVGLVVNFVFQGLAELFSSPNRVFAAVVVAGLTAAITKRFAATQPDAYLPRGLGLRLALWGLFLLLSAAFPYIAVGQQLASEGWLSRNCILCPLPVAMIACGLMMTANEWWLPSYPRAWLAGVAAFVTLGVGGCATNYLAYQALGAKQLSVRNGLSAAIHDSNVAVVQLRDYAHVSRTIPYYPPIIWTFIAHEGSGLPKTFVFETATLIPDVVQPGPDGQPQRRIPQIALDSQALDQAITDTTMPYALEGVPRQGPHILATVEPGYSGEKPSDLGLRYLFLSWLDHAKLADFIRGFTRISVHRLPPIE